MIPPEKSLKYWERHYEYILNKHGVNRKCLGVVSHGLRHEGTNKMYEYGTGKKSPVRGGCISQDEKDKDDLVRDQLSLELGLKLRLWFAS